MDFQSLLSDASAEVNTEHVRISVSLDSDSGRVARQRGEGRRAAPMALGDFFSGSMGNCVGGSSADSLTAGGANSLSSLGDLPPLSSLSVEQPRRLESEQLPPDCNSQDNLSDNNPDNPRCCML